VLGEGEEGGGGQYATSSGCGPSTGERFSFAASAVGRRPALLGDGSQCRLLGASGDVRLGWDAPCRASLTALRLRAGIGGRPSPGVAPAALTVCAAGVGSPRGVEPGAGDLGGSPAWPGGGRDAQSAGM